MVLLDVSPIDFQSQTVWRLISLVHIPSVGVPDVECKTSLLRVEFDVCETLPDGRVTVLGVSFWQDHLSMSYHLDLALILCFGVAV